MTAQIIVDQAIQTKIESLLTKITDLEQQVAQKDQEISGYKTRAVEQSKCFTKLEAAVRELAPDQFVAILQKTFPS
jgi:cell division septum initiation protein DivIVA